MLLYLRPSIRPCSDSYRSDRSYAACAHRQVRARACNFLLSVILLSAMKAFYSVQIFPLEIVGLEYCLLSTVLLILLPPPQKRNKKIYIVRIVFCVSHDGN